MTKFKKALDYAVAKTRENVEYFGDLFPAACSEDLIYRKVTNASMELWSDWTSSFYTGMIWLAYELTGEKIFLDKGKEHIKSFKKRLEERDIVGHHDVGFLYILSCLAGYRTCRDEEGRRTAIDAAYVLTERFQEKIGILQQNYSLTEESEHRGRFIIDSLLNIPLLFWASEVTGDASLYEKGYRHLKQAFKYLCREDGSTYQVCRLNADTGEIITQTTGQGFSANACWSRGQAWAVYGLPLNYHHTGDKEALDRAIKAADFFLSSLPKDMVCGWDLCFTEDDCQRDTSAAAIAVCGLLELSDILPQSHPKKDYYADKAKEILTSLIDNYSTEGLNSNGLLTGGVYSYNADLGVDECQIWGDYYYMEALVRIQKSWRSYWK